MRAELRAFAGRIPAWISAVLPLPCPLCGKGVPSDGSPNMFCVECLDRMPMIRGKVCRTCGAEADGIFESCSDCMNAPKPPWTRAYALFKYTDEVRDCVHLFKYRGRTELARPLSRLAAGVFDDESPRYDALVPVPLHWRRFLMRGYNQSALFARELSRRTGIPVRRLLKRRKHTPRQAFLTRKERNLNIQGAFSLFDSTAAEKCSILLVDDVMTTGATLSEAAGVLLNGGAARVDVLVIARRQRN